MDGILTPFERCLQMRNPRLERLDAVLPLDLWRRAAGALPTASQQSTHALRDRDAGRLCRLGAWRLLGFGLSLHSSAPPDPLLGCRAKGRDRNQTGESRDALRWLSGPRRKSCAQGQFQTNGTPLAAPTQQRWPAATGPDMAVWGPRQAHGPASAQRTRRWSQSRDQDASDMTATRRRFSLSARWWGPPTKSGGSCRPDESRDYRRARVAACP